MGLFQIAKQTLVGLWNHGEDDISIFEGHDFAFLGDIHKTNQVLDKAKKQYDMLVQLCNKIMAKLMIKGF